MSKAAELTMFYVIGLMVGTLMPPNVPWWAWPVGGFFAYLMISIREKLEVYRDGQA